MAKVGKKTKVLKKDVNYSCELNYSTNSYGRAKLSIKGNPQSIALGCASALAQLSKSMNIPIDLLVGIVVENAPKIANKNTLKEEKGK